MRVYRNVITGTTWIERGTGTPLIVIPDHGGTTGQQWAAPDSNLIVYDDELHAVERETIDAALVTERNRIRDQVAASTIPAVAKSTVRKIIEEGDHEPPMPAPGM